jgi:hypothetical protein
MFSAAGDGGSYNFTVIPSAIEGSSKKLPSKFRNGMLQLRFGMGNDFAR